MERSSTDEIKFISEDELDLRKLVIVLWKQRLIIALLTAMAAGCFAVYAYWIAKPIYVSSALLLPTHANSTGADLGAASALFGGRKAGGSADVDLYQSLLTSRTVIHKLLKEPFRNLSDTAKGRIEPLFQILGVDTTQPAQMEDAVENLIKSVVVGSKESGAGGILEIRFSAREAWLAQGFGNALLIIGQEELRIVRQERSQMIVRKLNQAAVQAKNEWDSAARALSVYKDRNRSISLPGQLLEVYRLELEKATKEQKYLLGRKELESQMIEIAKATPPMMILDSANLPAQNRAKKPSTLLMIGALVGLFTASIAVLIWNALIINAEADSKKVKT